jgi:hypothetical protein
MCCACRVWFRSIIRVDRPRAEQAGGQCSLGHLFAGFDPDGIAWRQMLTQTHEPGGIEGVIKLFTVNSKPLPLPERVVEDIRKREAALNENGHARHRRVPHGVGVGTLVRIIRPLAWEGLFGYVVAIDAHERTLKVELDIFGRKTPLALPPEHVEPLP